MGVCVSLSVFLPQYPAKARLNREEKQEEKAEDTFSGKKIGNQLIISGLFSSILSGFVLNSIPGYSVASKYPASP